MNQNKLPRLPPHKFNYHDSGRYQMISEFMCSTAPPYKASTGGPPLDGLRIISSHTNENLSMKTWNGSVFALKKRTAKLFGSMLLSTMTFCKRATNMTIIPMRNVLDILTDWYKE